MKENYHYASFLGETYFYMLNINKSLFLLPLLYT